MERIIPILPCQSIKEQVEFYQNLGFETIEVYTHPNPYSVMRYGMLEMHFYGSKKMLPSENANMCYIQVEDVDRVYETFSSSLKKNTGKIPRSGMPRVSKLRDLVNERRFTVTDVGGNTLYIGTPNSRLADETDFFRAIESPQYAKKFEILYDFLYSKEDVDLAFSMLIKNFPEDIATLKLQAIDLAKILLVALDIYLQRNKVIDEKINEELKRLLNDCKDQSSDWKRILQKYNQIVSAE